MTPIGTKEAHMGPRILGQERYDEIQAAKQQTIRQGNEVLGHRVTGGAPVEGTPAAAKAAQAAALPGTEPTPSLWDADVGGQSIGTLTETLANEPERFQALLANEKVRPGGPRKGALRAFISHANEHEFPAGFVAELTELL